MGTCVERCLAALLLVVPLWLSGIPGISAQERRSSPQRDSTVVEEPDGSTTITYSLKSYDFGPVGDSSAVRKRPSGTDKAARQEELRARTESKFQSLMRPSRSASPMDRSSYSVGGIPVQEGISPSGARIYQVPIATASGAKLAPSVSLCYSSQAGQGWAGYGWDIQGISSISLIPRNAYYHGAPKGADIHASDPVFALDGVPLVTNTQSGTMDAYPLATAAGNILAAPEYNNQGYVSSFNVLYPDGSTAVFGTGSNSGYTQPLYPVSQFTDINGNRMTFSYTSYQDNGLLRLDSICYGFNASGQHFGEIAFSYIYDQTAVVQYYAGMPMIHRYRLSGIVSYDNGTPVWSYSLSYSSKDRVNLLERIDCTSGGESLPPLTFEYGDPEDAYLPSAGALEKADSVVLSNNFNADNVSVVCRRGKFTSRRFNDGLLIYPSLSTYDVTDSSKPLFGERQYKFGSPYPENQTILFARNLSSFTNVDNSLRAGSGFQTMEAVDVDGDGLDELVKVNLNGTSGSSTVLRITVYECDNIGGAPVQSSQFDVLLNGTITSGNYVSPYNRTYLWGDFLGNGKTQLLTVAYDKNYNSEQNYDQTCYTALIDISTHSKLCDSELFTYSWYNKDSLLACDLDNDGQTELCFAWGNGLRVYRFGTSSFSLEHTYSGVGPDVLGSHTRPYRITDMNGDGYIDIMCAPAAGSGSTWDRYAFTGAGFVHSTLSFANHAADDEFMFIDVNRDGLADYVRSSGTALATYINRNGETFGAYSLVQGTVSSTRCFVPCNVVDYLGASAFIKVDGCNAYEFKCPAASPELRNLSKSVDSFGKTTFNVYEYLPKSSDIWTDSSSSVNNSAGYTFRTLPVYVLQSERAYLSENSYSGSLRNREFFYYDGVVHNTGLGFCGFSRIRTNDYKENFLIVVTDEYHDPQKRGVVTRIEQSLSDSIFHRVVNTYDSHTTAYGKLNPRLTGSTATDQLTGTVVSTSYTYDVYDCPLTVTTSRTVGNGTSQTEILSRTYQHSVVPSRYVLGSVTEESVEREADGDDELAWKEKTVTTYDSRYRPIRRRRYVGKSGTVIEEFPGHLTPIGQFDPFFPPISRPVTYDATNLVSETRWEYDTLGNVLFRKTAPYGAEVFTGDEYAYDACGRYMASTTDALGHTTSYGGYNRFGKPTTATDFRDRVTSFTYDAWGSLTSTTYPDGTVEQTASEWGGSGLYYITRTASGEPDTEIHYDALGREVRSGTKRFDGQWQWADTEYDSDGRVSRTSLPYRGSAASYWNTYAYDIYGRPVSVTEASGRVTSWSYSGTSVTTVKDGISSTSTTDASGNVISVTDAGGTVTYTLRDDGQPSSVTAPGSVVTSFSYDDYGRRTSISDPSAGTRSESFIWNSDGSSAVTATNPNGSVTTSRDRFGRAISVVRPGEYNTAYTYDSCGLLVLESSTNGTETEYGYDTYDRLSMVKESVPDGKWLQKSFTYSSDGMVSAISYSTQDGLITTENFAYANGHNTGITLSNGTVVFSLLSENNLGMTTAVQTGTIRREYGFTPFGMPTSRTMDGGNLQDFRYQFDPQNGNLLSRTDILSGMEEGFEYDSLNRLTEANGWQTTYAQNGNILYLDGIGELEYGNSSKPYQITTVIPEDMCPIPVAPQTISYTSFDRPSGIIEGAYNASFTYNGSGDRVRMEVRSDTTLVLRRHYIGGCYECDQTPDGSVERLYVGGDAYNAPMVLLREDGGSWQAYNVGRDYLGSITNISLPDGTPVAEYTYSPWGSLRDPATGDPYSPYTDLQLLLGRGFTGHEHLPWFGLINMNARLYDPLLGRFLSPDPFVQAPDFTQNFNRYSYALNNPLKYSDESGKWVHILIGGIIGGVANLAANWMDCDGFWEYFTSFCVGAGVGAAVAATGGAAAAASGSVWGTLGVVGSGAVGGSINGAISDIIGQTGKNFEEYNNIDWDCTWKSAAIGGVAGAAGAGIGIAMAGVHIPIKINGTRIESPIVSSFVTGAAAGAAGHLAGGTAMGLFDGKSLKESFYNSFDGIWKSALIGGAFSAASTSAYCIADNVNPLNGRAISNACKIYTPAQSLSEQLAFEEAMFNDGSIIIPAAEVRAYEWQGWDKMQYVYRNNTQYGINYLDYGNNLITVHYYQKTVNGFTYKSGFKFKY